MAPAARPILATSSDGTRVLYQTKRAASAATGIPANSIALAACNLTKRDGWIWKYADDPRQVDMSQFENIQTTFQVPAEERSHAEELVNAIRGDDGRLITEMRLSDGFICATKMCHSAGKTWSNYYQLTSTHEFIQSLANSLGPLANTSGNQLVDTIVNGPLSMHGAWVHPQLAIHLAAWCSPTFAVKVTALVVRYLTGQVSTAESQAAAQLIRERSAPVPQVDEWDQQRCNGIAVAHVKNDAIRDYISARFSNATEGARMYAQVNNLINQATVGYTSTTKKYKQDHAIPSDLSIPDMLDIDGQYVREKLEHIFGKYFRDRRNDYNNMNPEDALADLTDLRDKIYAFHGGVGLHDIEERMLSVEDAQRRKKAYGVHRRKKTIAPSGTSAQLLLQARPQVVQNITNSNTITNYFQGSSSRNTVRTG